MPSNRTPALLVVVVLSEQQQWFVAGISLVDGILDCLVRSEPTNLDAYVGETQMNNFRFFDIGSQARCSEGSIGCGENLLRRLESF
jgi:hypothetical protein